MMKSLLLKNPIPTKMDFAPGGSRVPILTRNPTQSTAGFQTFGLPNGSTPGGSANRTNLGAIRMGDQDGNAPASAIFPDDIFYPPGQADRKYTQVTFQNVGNNVFQPESLQTAAATESLLRELGDRKFKATESAPFEEYFASERLARDVDEASRSAGVQDLNYAREIMRNLVADRRKGNEDDFLRRMLDAGMSQQDAQDEIDNVRRANALQESRTVEDRTHQSKLLIQRIAKSRGILSSVNEPLTTTSAIENPQLSEKMANMVGQPENAYGSSPLDRDRVFRTVDYYTRSGQRSMLTQEAGDEMSALANATAQATGPVPTPLMLQGLERENAIERMRDSVASRLDSVTNRQRVMMPLPAIAEPFTDILLPAYRGKQPGAMARFKSEEVQDLSAFHSFVALNQAIAQEPAKLGQLKRLLDSQYLTERGRTTDVPRRDIRQLLRSITLEIIGRPEITIPFASEGFPLDDTAIMTILQRIKGSSRTELMNQQRATKPVVIPTPPVMVKSGAGRGAPSITFPPGSGRRSMGQAELNALTVRELQIILRDMGLPISGRKQALIQRILDAQ